MRGDYPPLKNGEFIHSTNNVLGSKNKKASFTLYLSDIEGTVHVNNTLGRINLINLPVNYMLGLRNLIVINRY